MRHIACQAHLDNSRVGIMIMSLDCGLMKDGLMRLLHKRRGRIMPDTLSRLTMDFGLSLLILVIWSFLRSQLGNANNVPDFWYRSNFLNLINTKLDSK